MKKTFLSMLMIASCFGAVNAQLLVDQNGKVGIGDLSGSNTLSSAISINSPGNSSYTLYSLTSPTASSNLGVNHHSLISSQNSYGISSSVYYTPNVTNYAINGSVGGSGGGTTKAVGVYGLVATSNNGYNYGVYGRLNTTKNGAGVFGSTSTAMSTEFPSIPGVYAGFFYGDTRVVGTLTATSIVQSSDYRLKDNIRSLSYSDDCLNKVMDMNVVEYNIKQREFETNVTEQDKADDAAREAEFIANGGDPKEFSRYKKHDKGRAYWHDEESPILMNKHYGLIAQELKEIYPNLVTESQDGYLAINYTEIIPLLIRSIQELNAKVEQYENGSAPIYKAQARTTDATSIDAVVTTLYQNTPNPFTESTLIRCDVANDVVKADLCIYNMNGEQITEYAITERGETSVVIDGGSLNAGMYLYVLIADGQVIDTKRMILTK